MSIPRRFGFVLLMRRVSLLILLAVTACSAPVPEPLPHISPSQLADELQVGDIVFIRVTALPFRKVAQDTGSWTNHVGIVTQTSDGKVIVGESTVPFSRATPLADFIGHSENGRVAVERLNIVLTPAQRDAIGKAAQARYGILYDTGFDLHSRREFCSRFVYEVLSEATGVKVGEVTTLRALLAANPDADMAFWRSWYVGFIPWDRETITPASMLASDRVHAVFDGYAAAQP